MKTPIIILCILLTGCKVQMNTWQRNGAFVKHGDAYIFKPYEQWRKFDTTKAFPDTVYEFVYAKKCPK